MDSEGVEGVSVGVVEFSCAFNLLLRCVCVLLLSLLGFVNCERLVLVVRLLLLVVGWFILVVGL